MNIKGSLQLLILNVLSQGPSHGYQIASEIKKRSSGLLDFQEGTLYPTLHNMERAGLLEVSDAEENGRTRRYYRLTESGKNMFKKELAEWQQFTRAVNSNLEVKE